MPEDLTPPEDLVKTKALWIAARAEALRISQEQATGTPPVSYTIGKQAVTRPLLTEEHGERLATARARVTVLTGEIFEHPWKKNPPGGDRLGAEKTLNEAAEAMHAADPAGLLAQLHERFEA